LGSGGAQARERGKDCAQLLAARAVAPVVVLPLGRVRILRRLVL